MKAASVFCFKTTLFFLSLFYCSMAEVASAAQVTFSSSTSFGKVLIGTTKDVAFTVKNTGTKKIRLDSYWFNSVDSYKVVGGTCAYNQTTGYSLAAGKSCILTIRFSPLAAALFNGSFTLGYFLDTGWTWGEANLSLSAQGVKVLDPLPLPIPTLTSSPTPTPTPTAPAPLTGWLRVEGTKIVNSQGQQVILKGVNIADPEHLNTKVWERPNVNARSIASLATDQYFAEIVRLPVLPGNPAFPSEGFFSPTNGFDIYFKNHIQPLVNDLTSKGIYVIIDLHYTSDYADLYPQVEKFWTFMAPKFANNPYVIYEIFNEPIGPNNWSTWKNTIAQPATNLIRSLAPNNLIFIGGPYWSSNMIGAVDNPVAGTNLVYIAHVYSNQTPAMWDARYGTLAATRPLFISEWGFEMAGTEGGDLNYGKSFEAWMRERKLGWTAWSFDTLWGPRMFNADWTLRGGQGGQGTFIRDLLQEEHVNNLP